MFLPRPLGVVAVLKGGRNFSPIIIPRTNFLRSGRGRGGAGPWMLFEPGNRLLRFSQRPYAGACAMDAGIEESA